MSNITATSKTEKDCKRFSQRKSGNGATMTLGSNEKINTSPHCDEVSIVTQLAHMSKLDSFKQSRTTFQILDF